MSRPVIYVAITSHGFGHAVRTASVVSATMQLNPEILPILVTTVPHWLLESYIEGDFIQRSRSFDVGLVQTDSLKMDKAATLKKMQQIRSDRNKIIAGEVDFIRTNKVGLILADIPPLAAAIAKSANLPCWMMSNFGWDYIYQDWGEDFKEIVNWVRDDYQRSERTFRLPLSEPMNAFPNITDVGLTGGNPRYKKTELRETFNLTKPKQRTILLTFGGLGLQAIPYHNLEQFSDWQFITFDRCVPNLPNLIKIEDLRYRPVDFMPLCDRVVSKPGYSTFAEALRTQTPIVSLTRDDFAEAAVLLAGIQNYGYHQIVKQNDFFTSQWNFLHQAPLPPIKPNPLPTDGNEIIAKAIVKFFQK